MFNMGNGGASLADISALMNRSGGFGGDGSGMWALIIILAACGAFNGDGFGNGGNNNRGEVQRGFDTSQIISKLDGINNGICSLGYDQLSQMNGINSNIMQSSFGIQQAINNDTVANMRNTNDLTALISDCCCKNQTSQMQMLNQMSQDTCAITTAIQQAVQAIMQNDNANYRQLHDENIQLQIQGYKEQLAAKDQLINSLNLAQSQSNQNVYIQSLIDALYAKLSPTPVPSYEVDNPNCCSNGLNSKLLQSIINNLNNNGSLGCCNGNNLTVAA